MQLSELRKKAKRGKVPGAEAMDLPVPLSAADQAPAPRVQMQVSEDDEFLSPPAATLPPPQPPVQPDVAPSAVASRHSASLLESMAAVEASPQVAQRAEPEPLLAQQGLLEDITDTATDDDLVEYISFLAAGEPYVIRISRVKEIIRPRRLAVVPRAPAYVRGILSLRGEMIPVLDLRRSLGLSLERDVGSALDSRIIVLAHNGAKLGLQVDRLEGVVRLDENLFRDPSEVQGSRDNRFLQAIGRFRGSFVIVLDVEEFFARGEK